MHLDFDKLFLGLTNSFLEYSESLRKLKNNAFFYIVNTHLQPFKGKILEIISFSNRGDNTLQRAVLHFNSTIIIKITIGSSNSMKYKPNNDQSHFSVFVEHGFVVSQTHTSI